ncbi:LPXTG cell wall anchor domain-containing protein [Micromonospora sp. CPCC 206061]|uniref:LPXTG cell wall anchor domain-containing protein n=1 Tax=Micromonospora sp. CPCC 206061 TaxID=3122410 RepID=UPI002FF41E1C
MKMYLRALGAAAMTAGVLAVPSVANAADDAPLFAALSERDEAGRAVTYPIRQGESVPVVLGVANVGTAASAGVVVNVRVFNDVDLPRTFTNCQYYVDSNLEGAWCEIDQELAAGSGTYALSPFQVAAAREARADRMPAIVFQWFPKDWVDENGGIAEFAKKDSGQGTTPAAGTEGTLGLVAKQLVIPAETSRVGFAYVKLATVPSPTPTASPSGSSPATPGTTPPADGSGGGLPVTGADGRTLGIAGATLVIAGVVAFLVARRRRARFTT